MIKLKDVALGLFSTVSDGIFNLKQIAWSVASPEQGVAFGKRISILRGLCVWWYSMEVILCSFPQMISMR